MKLCECGCGTPTLISQKTERSRGWVRGQPRRFIRGHQIRVHNPSTDRQNEKSPNWKGDNVGYRGLHIWIAKVKPHRMRCEHCGRKSQRTEWANVSGEYKRDLDDFIELCVRCHRAMDEKRRKGGNDNGNN